MKKVSLGMLTFLGYWLGVMGSLYCLAIAPNNSLCSEFAR
jgi:hypothetical protein